MSTVERLFFFIYFLGDFLVVVRIVHSIPFHLTAQIDV